jgi:phosphoglycerol transferase MdoB-like AlkP superfamily enzyme
MEKLKNSPLGDNTLVVFTGDHCAYGDLFYRRAFPAYERVNTDVDEMPLAIWHRDVVPETIDVKGRNTLDMVPTLLDYLDISAPNYFLGTSLFGPGEEDGPRFDTLFYDATYTLSTEGGSIRPLTDRERKRFEKALVRYFTAKTQKAGREK